MHSLFEMTPISQTANIFFAVLTLMFIGLGCVFAWMYIGCRNVSVLIEGNELTLKAPFYGRSIELTELDFAAIKIVNLKKEPDLLPRIRTNGIGLPGYSLGWFRLRNGRKALLAVSNKQEVVYLPTRAGYDLLLSLKQPELFLQKLSQ